MANFVIDKLELTDSNQLYQFMIDNNERLQQFFPLTLSSNSTLEKSSEYIAIKNKEIEEKTNFTFAIRDKNNQQIIGLIIIKKLDWDKNQGEFAYCIGSEYEGNGLTSFAVKEMTNFAFEDLGLKTLQIIAHKSNLGSVKVAENIGFVWQSTLQNEFTPINGTPLDMELYELYNEK
ncbi:MULTISPECIES: GNAT family N-acetyltransferase [unclassified Flavobacterium]|uniref:GNAT family N-acetyltransferase n=1 Tax=unclassified Flavobacterium TaxID=196869 RepID=UPI00131ADF16|nr:MULTISPECIES: GNAT family N-acetyltransferase [unclassified Flavobacterium]